MDTRYGYKVDTSAIRRRPIIYTVDNTLASYTIELSQSYRDVISIELIKAVIPNPDTDNYLIIKIVNLDTIHGNTTALEGALCTVERSVALSTPIVYQRDNIQNIHYYDQPTKLSRLQIDILRPNGLAPDFGTANPHVLVFEINTLNQPPLPIF